MPIAETFKPFVVPIFIPHAGCPHRCVFCNQTRTTSLSEELPTTGQIDETVERFLGYRKDARRFTEVSFYGGNFLGLPTEHIRYFLESVTKYIDRGQIQGIRFSTRPDTITPQRLNLLARFRVSTIELGVQSMNNDILKASRRDHTVQDIHNAVTLLKKRDYRLGLQMMVGLPGDTAEAAMGTGEQIADLEPDFVRIYPTVVLAGSQLAVWHEQSRYTPLPLDDAVRITKQLYLLFTSRGINVIRMGLQATEGLDTGSDLVTGPFHPAFGELVHAALWLDVIRNGIQDFALQQQPIIVTLNPKLVSRVKGQKRQNIKRISNEFALGHIQFSMDPKMPLDMIRLNGNACQLYK